jgi:hypothetical protein
MTCALTRSPRNAVQSLKLELSVSGVSLPFVSSYGNTERGTVYQREKSQINNVDAYIHRKSLKILKPVTELSVTLSVTTIYSNFST